MDTLHEIRQGENGVYSWYGVVDKRYELKTFKIVFGVCGGICLFYIIAMLLVAPDMLWVILLCTLAVMTICGGVCWLFWLNAGKRRQYYELSEWHVTFGKGYRRRTAFSYKSIRKAVVYPSRHMIELYPLIGSGPVFAPPEDYEFVRDFILTRIPDGADVIRGE